LIGCTAVRIRDKHLSQKLISNKIWWACRTGKKKLAIELRYFQFK